MKPSSIALAVVVAALVGASIFGSLVHRSVSVKQASSSEALTRFTAVREKFAGQRPLLEVDASGAVTRSAERAGAASPAPVVKRLRVLGYRAGEERLIEADVPFWFLRLKGPALEFAVRDTGLDLERLKLTPDELSRHGAGLVLDQIRPNGDRLLVWAE
ncbi:MAG: hypothetical protein ABI672_11735 [Vicinamibacteria bacterium]